MNKILLILDDDGLYKSEEDFLEELDKETLHFGTYGSITVDDFNKFAQQLFNATARQNYNPIPNHWVYGVVNKP